MIARILVTFIIIMAIFANPFNLSSNDSIDVKEESLTNKYINSLREGKWGAAEPSWVKKKVAKEFFPKVTKLGRLEGDPPTVSVFSKGELEGYLFVTKDITSSKG